MVAIGLVVSEEKSFEIVDGRMDGRTDDGRTTDGRRTTKTAYAISSHGAFGSGELKIIGLISIWLIFRSVISCPVDCAKK